MGLRPEPRPIAIDPGTQRTVAQVVKVAIRANHTRVSWGIVADKANTDFIVVSMGGDPALATGVTDAGLTLGQAQINAVTAGATGTSLKLAAGQSFSEPVGATSIYTGAVTVAANSGTQTYYSWSY